MNWLPMSAESRAEAARLADQAECIRCNVKIMSEASATGAILGIIRTPMQPGSESFLLCGKCGLAFYEFLEPGNTFDVEFQAAKARLLQEWA